MIKHTSELLLPEGMLNGATHEGETIYIPAKQKKKKKTLSAQHERYFHQKEQITVTLLLQ